MKCGSHHSDDGTKALLLRGAADAAQIRKKVSCMEVVVNSDLESLKSPVPKDNQWPYGLCFEICYLLEMRLC